MAITINLRYTGTGGNARVFAEEMMSSGTVDKICAEKGNLRYEYYVSLVDPETVLLIDSWADQEAMNPVLAPMVKTLRKGIGIDLCIKTVGIILGMVFWPPMVIFSVFIAMICLVVEFSAAHKKERG